MKKEGEVEGVDEVHGEVRFTGVTIPDHLVPALEYIMEECKTKGYYQFDSIPAFRLCSKEVYEEHLRQHRLDRKAMQHLIVRE